MSILVVDVDQPSVARRLEWLTQAGYAASGATSFEEGTLLLEQRPALLVVACRLGAFNGIHLVMRGRSRNPQLPAIVLGNTAGDGAVDAQAFGAVFGVKPESAEELLALVAAGLSETPV